MRIRKGLRRLFRFCAQDSLDTATAPLLAALGVLQHKVESLQLAVDAGDQKLSDIYKKLLRHQIECAWRLMDLSEFNSDISEWLVCPLCDTRGLSNNFRSYTSECIFSGGILQRHQCPHCDVIFGPQKMLNLSRKGLASDYDWHYQVFSEGDSTAQEVRAFHALHPSRDGVYLNWGAGSWSTTISLLRADGWNVFGYEPHQTAANASPFVIGSANQLSDMKFDGIFSNNVLEHLRAPVIELAAMRELLKVGGKMSHATPCFEYLYEFTRFHLFFFLGRSRALLAEMADLKIEEFIVDGEFMDLVLSRKIV